MPWRHRALKNAKTKRERPFRPLMEYFFTGRPEFEGPDTTKALLPNTFEKTHMLGALAAIVRSHTCGIPLCQACLCARGQRAILVFCTMILFPVIGSGAKGWEEWVLHASQHSVLRISRSPQVISTALDWASGLERSVDGETPLSDWENACRSGPEVDAEHRPGSEMSFLAGDNNGLIMQRGWEPSNLRIRPPCELPAACDCLSVQLFVQGRAGGRQHSLGAFCTIQGGINCLYLFYIGERY